jgi:hypothetical protein
VKLEDALQECTLALLRKIAASHSVAAAEDTLRSELASQITLRFAEPDYVLSIVAALDEQEKQVLRFLSTHDWTGKAFLLERQFQRDVTAVHSPLAPCIALLQKGLIYRSFGAIDSWRGELYHVPVELRPAISSSLPDAPTPALPEVRSVGEPTVADERDAAFDVFCLLSFLRKGDRRSYQGTLSRFDLPKLEQEVGGRPSEMETGDAERRWHFLVHLALAGGWIFHDGPFLRLGRGVPQLLEGESRQVRQRLVERYTRDRSWSDLNQAGRVRQSLGNRRIDEARARQFILHHLQEFAGQEWIGEDSFCDAVRAVNPDFLREDYASLTWAVMDVAAETEVYGAESWAPVEGEWIRYVLRGPLYWLGVVRWGRDISGRRVALQLAPEIRGPAQPSLLRTPHQYLVFRDDTNLLAPPGVELGLLYSLEPYLVLRGRDATGSSYRFTRGSVLHGMEVGGTLDELLDLIGQLSAGPSPQLLNQLREWAFSYGRTVLEGGVLLTAATEDEAESLAALPEIGPCLGERLGGRSYKVKPDSVWELIEALKRAGQTPRIDPSVGSQRLRSATGDLLLLQESLLALLVLRSLHGTLQIDHGAEVLSRLESILGPEIADAVSKRAQDLVKRLRTRGDAGGW